MDSRRLPPTINLVATGRKIVELREARGLTVKDLQVYFGFDAPQAIYKWQKGQTLPTVDNLLALSELLGVPMESILVRNGVNVTLLTDHEPEGSVFLCSDILHSTISLMTMNILCAMMDMSLFEIGTIVLTK